MAKYLLDLPDELHREAKIRAAMEGTTLKEMFLEALKEYLAKKEKA